MAEGPERSRPAYTRASDAWRVTVTADLAARVKRVTTLAQAAAAGGKYPQVLEDVNVILVRLLEHGSGCDPATAVVGESTLEAGDFLSVTQAARLLGCSPQAIRKVCGGPRLPATKVAGVWMIAVEDLEKYRYQRRRHGHHADHE
jgi:hypothetical protein